MSQSPFELPPYTHIPGKTPHPVSDPEGHSHGQQEDLQVDRETTFQRALYLFENGYYWEAHEAWEQVWIVLGRKGPEADFVKGLIKLAACGVKCLEENRTGAERHLKRAQELLSSSQARKTNMITSHESLVEEMITRVEALP